MGTTNEHIEKISLQIDSGKPDLSGVSQAIGQINSLNKSIRASTYAFDNLLAKMRQFKGFSLGGGSGGALVKEATTAATVIKGGVESAARSLSGAVANVKTVLDAAGGKTRKEVTSKSNGGALSTTEIFTKDEAGNLAHSSTIIRDNLEKERRDQDRAREKQLTNADRAREQMAKADAARRAAEQRAIDARMGQDAKDASRRGRSDYESWWGAQLSSPSRRHDFESPQEQAARRNRAEALWRKHDSKWDRARENEANSLRLADKPGKNFIDNAKHVTVWAASVMALYKSFELLGAAIKSTTDIQYQQARLSQVYRYQASEVGLLTSSVLELAAANGRSTKEAMDAAIQWSRMGLNRRQVIEAVRVSLMAANVAEISASEATDNLSSIMVVYGLRVSELNGVLGQLNNTSNTYNVTVKDLLDGLSRAAAIAQQAGVSFAELQGLIAAGVGATGQTGANIGNSLKSIFGALSSADKQGMLRSSFGFETTNAGELKNMSQILSELYVKYQQLSSSERQTMLYSVAGKNQASRMAAVLDNYLVAMLKAADGLRNLNSAEQENEKIKATLKAQTAGLVAEWERFWSIQSQAPGIGGGGPIGTLTRAVAGLKSAFKILNSEGISTVTHVVLGGIAAMATGLLLAELKFASMSKEASFSRSTILAFKRELNYGIEAMKAWVYNSGGMTRSLSGITQGANGALVATSRLRAGLAFLGKSVVVLAAIALAVESVSYAFRSIGDALGGGTDAAVARIEALGEASDVASKKAEAATISFKALNTASEAFRNATTVERRKGIAEGAANLAGMGNDQRAQLIIASEIADATERQARFDGLIAQSKAKQSEEARRYRQEAMYFQAAEIGEARRNRDMLIFKKADRKEVEAAEKRLAEATGKRMQYINDAADDDPIKKIMDGDAHKKFQSVLDSVAESMRQAFDTIPVEGHLGKLDLEIAKNKELLRVIDAQMESNNQRIKASGADLDYVSSLSQTGLIQKSVGDQGVELQQYIKRQAAVMSREKFLPFMRSVTGMFHEKSSNGSPWKFSTSQRWMEGIAYDEGRSRNSTAGEFEVRSKIGDWASENFPYMTEAQKRMVLGELSGGKNPAISKYFSDLKILGGINDTISKVEGNRELAKYVAANETLRKQRSDIAEKQAGLESPANRHYNDVSDRNQLWARIGGARIEAQGWGVLPGEQLANRQNWLNQQNKPFMAQGGGFNVGAIAGLNEKERFDLNMRIIAAYDNQLKMKERLFELDKEERTMLMEKTRELQKQMMMMGPGDLLRTLAMKNMYGNRKGPISAGEMMAMDPSMRERYTQLFPQYSMDAADKRRERGILKAAGADKTEDQLDAWRSWAEPIKKALIESLKPAQPLGDLFNSDAIKTAVTQISTLGTEAQQAADNLRRIANVIFGPAVKESGKIPPLTPQTTFPSKFGPMVS